MISRGLSLLCLLMQGCCGTLFWDQLKVRFDNFDCNHEKGFFDLPRTESKALESGYNKLSDCTTDISSVSVAGKRYRKRDAYEPILLFDINGYIAGIQSAFPNIPGFPHSSLVNHPYIEDQGELYINFYFVEPTTICNGGRNQESFRKTGTGSNLFIQNGSTPLEVTEVPNYEVDLGHTDWKKGICLPIMGQHYRFNYKVDSDCERLFPVFIMYNNGRLDGFGWTITERIESEFLEHPPPIPAPGFPECVLGYRGRLTGLHFYLTEPCNRTCPPR